MSDCQTKIVSEKERGDYIQWRTMKPSAVQELSACVLYSFNRRNIDRQSATHDEIIVRLLKTKNERPINYTLTE